MYVTLQLFWTNYETMSNAEEVYKKRLKKGISFECEMPSAP
jgi:hypothetical protein